MLYLSSLGKDEVAALVFIPGKDEAMIVGKDEVIWIWFFSSRAYAQVSVKTSSF